MVPHRWRKSSRSGSQTNCVELAHTLDRVRDSKNISGPALPVAGLVEFLSEIKQGRFDR
jgi:hypothetical protein